MQKQEEGSTLHQRREGEGEGRKANQVQAHTSACVSSRGEEERAAADS